MIVLFLGLVTSQTDGPPTTTCVEESNHGCVKRCSCIFCTQNQTLATGLINGTIPPKVLKGSNDQGVCIDGTSKCKSEYYTVPGSSVIEVNGGSCNFLIVFIVVASILFGILILMCAVCCVYAIRDICHYHNIQ